MAGVDDLDSSTATHRIQQWWVDLSDKDRRLIREHAALPHTGDERVRQLVASSGFSMVATISRDGVPPHYAMPVEILAFLRDAAV